eukprot:CAMPEP_0180145518 /NCGR_PEP_ID=MMETSP0986-20121125/17738_1 /TAXON_ID=697907 /ORGANISM="non described non described, Strain CCMP2293" /LENGTH=265 /DNA_ID=CAMNT_0022089951 /DNA_START=376 /DNA_END=1174 /DNA_ORIENTATION=-
MADQRAFDGDVATRVVTVRVVIVGVCGVWQNNERSVIVTAAHCIFDDVSKAFARNVLFIPNQAETSGGGTDFDCSNDPLGCWAPAFGVVDVEWTTRTFPSNAKWDYGFYVVETSGAHLGTDAGSDSLEVAAGSMAVSFASPKFDDASAMGEGAADYARALGYSYSHDPSFMFCAQDLTLYSATNWWLSSCGLSGGASGGPWLQASSTPGEEKHIFSVNSWGFTSLPGMAGPRFDAGFAQVLTPPSLLPPATASLVHHSYHLILPD